MTGNIVAYAGNAIMTYGIGVAAFGEAFMKKYGLRTNKEMSALYPTIITPKGWAFAIWGPIFVGEAAFTVYQAMAPQHAELLQRVSPYWQLACAGQAAWTVVFARDQQPLAAFLLPCIAVALQRVYSLVAVENLSGAAYWCVHVPFALHCAWLACASVVQLSIMQSACRGLFGEVPSEVSLSKLYLAGATVATGALAASYNDMIPAVVGAWALKAISVNTLPPDYYGCKKMDLVAAEGCHKLAKWGSWSLLGLSAFLGAKLLLQYVS